MVKYKKKPVVIDAEPYRKGLEDGVLCKSVIEGQPKRKYCINKNAKNCFECANTVPFIDTLEGRHYISKDDYIVTGIMGERYPVKKEIFEKTYERVEE